MPLNKYFGGHGKEVMSKMKKGYGAKKGKEVFYATINERKDEAAGKALSHRGRPKMK